MGVFTIYVFTCDHNGCCAKKQCRSHDYSRFWYDRLEPTGWVKSVGGIEGERILFFCPRHRDDAISS